MTSISDQISTATTYLSDMIDNDTLSFVLFVVSSLCMHEWAFIHYAAMATISTPAWSGNTGTSMTMIFAGSPIIDEYETYEYPTHTNRVFIQHGINLGIAGFFADLTIPAMMFGWESAIWIAFVPFLVDVGYFIAADLPELGSIPAAAQTYIVSIGIICTSIYTYRNSTQGSWDLLMMVPGVAAGILLINAGIVNLVVWHFFGGWSAPILNDGTGK
jgi:hypothetical protein